VSRVYSTWLLPLGRDHESRPKAVTRQKRCPGDVRKAGRLESRAVFAFCVGLAGIKGIEENQIEAHGLERRGMRIIQNLANDAEPAGRGEGRPDVLEDPLRVVGRQYLAAQWSDAPCKGVKMSSCSPASMAMQHRHPNRGREWCQGVGPDVPLGHLPNWSILR
jgi:hypothetical protein